MWPGRAPDLQRLVADLQQVALVDGPVDLAARHGDVDSLGVDPGVGQDLVPFLDRGDALGVRGHLALENLAGTRQPLGVIDVGVRRDDHLAGGQAEIHLPDQLQHVGQLVEEPDVDQGEFRPAINQIDVHAHPALRLVVHFEHAREHVTPLDHSELTPLNPDDPWMLRECRVRQRPTTSHLYRDPFYAAGDRLNEAGNENCRDWERFRRVVRQT